MDFLFLVVNFFIFVFGLCIGSFLNSIIYRLKEKKSIFSYSFCPKCKHFLNWKDLFPLISFIFLKGKCRYCHKKISFQYPLVELVTGFLFLFFFNFFYPSFLKIIFYFYLVSSFIIIFVYDLKHYIIPDVVVFPAIFVTILFRLLETFLKEENFYFQFISPDFSLFENSLLNAFFFSGFLFLLFFVSKGKWMGFGDVKLIFLMGLVLDFFSLLIALFLASLIGSLIGGLLVLLKKKTLRSTIPFAPFLIFGAFISFFWGPKIIHWYISLLTL